MTLISLVFSLVLTLKSFAHQMWVLGENIFYRNFVFCSLKILIFHIKVYIQINLLRSPWLRSCCCIARLKFAFSENLSDESSYLWGIFSCSRWSVCVSVCVYVYVCCELKQIDNYCMSWNASTKESSFFASEMNLFLWAFCRTSWACRGHSDDHSLVLPSPRTVQDQDKWWESLEKNQGGSSIPGSTVTFS